MFLGDNPGMGPYDAPADQPAITADQAAQYRGILAELAAKEAEYNQVVSDLQSRADFVATQAPDVRAEYQSMLDRAQGTQAVIANIHAAASDVVNALKGAWNYVTGIWGQVESTVSNALSLQGWGGDRHERRGFYRYSLQGGLGFLPLVPVAAIAAAVALISYFVTDAVTLLRKLDLLKSYTDKGASPQQAADAIAKASAGAAGGSVTGTIGTVALVGGALALLFLLPRLIGSYRSAMR